VGQDSEQLKRSVEESSTGDSQQRRETENIHVNLAAKTNDISRIPMTFDYLVHREQKSDESIIVYTQARLR